MTSIESFIVTILVTFEKEKLTTKYGPGHDGRNVPNIN